MGRGRVRGFGVAVAGPVPGRPRGSDRVETAHEMVRKPPPITDPL